MKYKIIEDLTSDVMFEAYGKDKKELFENAAEALFSVICDIKKIKPLEEITVEISAENSEELLIEWLQHLIALVDIEEMFFSRFEIRQISNTKLKAVCYGSIAEPESGGTVVKAITRHKFFLKKNDNGYTARVVCDI